jgi:hypothetical protein
MNNKNISVPVPNTPGPIEVVKTGKVAISRFYDDSFYMGLRNKVSYYPEDNCGIFAYGFNNYVYKFFVQKNSRIVRYSIYEQVHDRRLPRFDIIYDIDDSVHTIMKTVKELLWMRRDCFENYGVVFVLIKEEILPDVVKVAPPLQFEYNINKYNDITFIM